MTDSANGSCAVCGRAFVLGDKVLDVRVVSRVYEAGVAVATDRDYGGRNLVHLGCLA